MMSDHTLDSAIDPEAKTSRAVVPEPCPCPLCGHAATVTDWRPSHLDWLVVEGCACGDFFVSAALFEERLPRCRRRSVRCTLDAHSLVSGEGHRGLVHDDGWHRRRAAGHPGASGDRAREEVSSKAVGPDSYTPKFDVTQPAVGRSLHNPPCPRNDHRAPPRPSDLARREGELYRRRSNSSRERPSWRRILWKRGGPISRPPWRGIVRARPSEWFHRSWLPVCRRLTKPS